MKVRPWHLVGAALLLSSVFVSVCFVMYIFDCFVHLMLLFKGF